MTSSRANRSSIARTSACSSGAQPSRSSTRPSPTRLDDAANTRARPPGEGVRSRRGRGRGARRVPPRAAAAQVDVRSLSEAGEEPELGRIEIDVRSHGELVVDAPAVLAPRERRHDPLQLGQRFGLAGHREALGDALRPRRSCAAAPRAAASSAGTRRARHRLPRRTPAAATRRTRRCRPRAPRAAAARRAPDSRLAAAGRPGGSALATFVASRLAKIAPKIETPIEPPTWRKSVEPEVATPSCSYGTEFCAARTRTCIVIPSPKPSTSM